MSKSFNRWVWIGLLAFARVLVVRGMYIVGRDGGSRAERGCGE